MYPHKKKPQTKNKQDTLYAWVHVSVHMYVGNNDKEWI